MPTNDDAEWIARMSSTGDIGSAPGGGGGGGDVTTAQLTAAVAVLQDKATAATDAEVSAALTAALATVDAELVGKQDAVSAATDAELIDAVTTINVALALTASDAEVAAAVSTINAAMASGLAGKQDAATAATDTELATGLAGKQDAATAATDAELAAAVQREIFYVANETATVTATTTGGGATVPLLTGTVPNDPLPVWVEAHVFVDITVIPTAGTVGAVGLYLVDELGAIVASDQDSTNDQSQTNSNLTLTAKVRIPPNSGTKSYTVVANRFGDTAFRADIKNGNGGAYTRSYITANRA